jgi:peptide/nickel transport system permease protein
MTEQLPRADRLAEDRDEVSMTSGRVGPRTATGVEWGSRSLPDGSSVSTPDLTLSYESGVELKARSQWAYARMRFFRHKLAVASLIFLIFAGIVAMFPAFFAPYAYDEFDFEHIVQGPTLDGWHLFGTDQLGRDYLSRVIFGLQTSLWVALFVGVIATFLGTVVGAIAGYYGGVVDNLLMRLVDLLLVVPFLVVLLVLSAYLGQGKPFRVGFILALLIWLGLARIVRGVFLSLREKEFVEAAKAAGAGDLRIMFRHMLPSTVGPIVVTLTLLIAAAILIEAALSFLGFGIKPPTPSLGVLVSDAQANPEQWWLTIFPGLTIVAIVLCVNFVGDGLRDALDPTQRRMRA